jgi:hypothetical protein
MVQDDGGVCNIGKRRDYRYLREEERYIREFL